MRRRRCTSRSWYPVERLAGYEVARQTGRALLIDPPRTWQVGFSAPQLRQLLEAEFRPLQQVCYAVGYEEVPFFRSVFRRHTGLSPADYRRRQSGARANP